MLPAAWSASRPACRSSSRSRSAIPSSPRPSWSRRARRPVLPVLTGHHRNYSPIMAKAREIVRSGALGSVVAVVGTALFYKPDDYFETGGGWRRQPGGGPILLNLIHEVNNLLSLVGRHRPGAGGDVERDPRVSGRGHRGHGLHLRERRAGHVSAVRYRGVTAVLGADVAGEQELRQSSRRGLLPHRRHQGVAVRPDHAVEGLRRRCLLVGAVHVIDGGPGAHRSAGQPDRAFRRGDPRRGRTRLQRPGRAEDAAGGGRRHRGRPHAACR